MRTISARELLYLTEDEIWTLPNEPIEAVFDDGVIQTMGRALIISWYFWEIHRRYPDTPLLINHSLQPTTTDDGDSVVFMSSNTHCKILSAIAFDSFDSTQRMNPQTDEIAVMETMSKIICEVIGNFYSAMTYRLEAYPTSINITDLHEIMSHPVVSEANRLVKPDTETTDDTVENTYHKITTVLLNHRELPNNQVALLARHNLIRMGQTLQCVGPRGYCTDIDSRIFRKPILTGYTAGLRNIEDIAKDSRSAAKALILSKAPMQDSQYLNRNLQLMAQTFSNLHPGDCGSKETIEFCVKPGSLKDLEGIYHLTEKGFERININDKHLLGKVIHIRSPFTCHHPDPYGACIKCFGELGLNIPRLSNIGHFSTIVPQGKLTQSVLSTKHLDTNSTTEGMVIDDHDSRYIRLGSVDNNQIFVTEHLAKEKFSIIIKAENVREFGDLMYVDDVKSLIPSRVSELPDVEFLINKGGVEVLVSVCLNTGKRNASLTRRALEFIKTRNWNIDSDGNYTIDMTGWDHENPMFELPLKHYSMVDYMGAVEACVKGIRGKKEKSSGVKPLVDFHQDVSGALAEFYDLISSKLNVHISHLQMMMLTTMVESTERGNFFPPAPGNIGEFSYYNINMASRSLSPMMAYQDQAPTLLRMRSYLITNRPAHPLDDMLVP